MSGKAISSAIRMAVSNGGEASAEEKRRRRRLRQMARKTPEQRRRLLQYQRRHNEKDGRLFYCDYCDLFVSARDKPLEMHMGSWKHMEAVEAFWHMAAHAEPLWMKEIHDGVQQAWTAAQARHHQRVHGIGAAVAIPRVEVAPGVCVGGAGAASIAHSPPPSSSSSPAQGGSSGGVLASPTTPSTRV